MKKCLLCLEDKPLDQFNKSIRQKDGHNYYCRPCNNAYLRGLHAKNNDSRRARRYNITVEHLRELLSKGCAVCGSEEGLVIDHDHNCCPGRSCGKCVRGALCGNHNTALGKFNDDPEALIAAAAYLLSFENVLNYISKD